MSASLPSARQHPSYDVCLKVKREYYQNCSVLGCVTQCSQSAAHSYEQFLLIQQIWFVTLGPLRHTQRRLPRVVTWWSGPGWIQALPERPTGFLQCFDTGLVIWPVKIVPDMTYNVFGGTLNLAQSVIWCLTRRTEDKANGTKPTANATSDSSERDRQPRRHDHCSRCGHHHHHHPHHRRRHGRSRDGGSSCEHCERCSLDDNVGVCSNRMVQIAVIVLVLIMAIWWVTGRLFHLHSQDGST